MKITGNHQEIARYLQQTSEHKTKAVEAKATTDTGAVASGGQNDAVVQLSQASREIQAAQEAIAALPPERAEKVEFLKQKVESGNYEPNPQKTADAMVKAFFDEIA